MRVDLKNSVAKRSAAYGRRDAISDLQARDRCCGSQASPNYSAISRPSTICRSTSARRDFRVAWPQRLRQIDDAAADRGPRSAGQRRRSRLAAGTLFSADSGIFVPAQKRNMGMVFQSYAIWPHLTVFENVAYPAAAARHRRGGDRRSDARMSSARSAWKAWRTAPRPRLSGGQQQRVALARALVYRAGGAAAGRAVLQPRRQAARADARRAEAAAPAGRRDGDPGDA